MGARTDQEFFDDPMRSHNGGIKVNYQFSINLFELRLFFHGKIILKEHDYSIINTKY